jgi:uncharacterized protein YodC (DUF2158 family)
MFCIGREGRLRPIREFERGAVVTLKALPELRMTVEAIAEDLVGCVWHDAEDVRRGYFEPNDLMLEGAS